MIGSKVWGRARWTIPEATNMPTRTLMSLVSAAGVLMSWTVRRVDAGGAPGAAPDAPRSHASVLGHCGGEVVHLGVSAGERRQAEAVLDRGEDRGRVVDRVVDARTLQPATEDQRRDPRARSPCVDLRRGHVVPLATELVIGHDHERVAGLGAVPDRLEQVDQVIRAVRLTRVARVLVLRAVRLDERDRGQGAVL